MVINLRKKPGTRRLVGDVTGMLCMLGIVALCMPLIVLGDDTVEYPVVLDMGMTVHALGDVGANHAVAAVR